MARRSLEPGVMEAAKRPAFATRPSRLAERLGLPYLDRVMLAASIGLIAFSVFTLASATRHEIAGQPLYFATRQGLYAVIGIALMIAISPHRLLAASRPPDLASTR